MHRDRGIAFLRAARGSENALKLLIISLRLPYRSVPGQGLEMEDLNRGHVADFLEPMGFTRPGEDGEFPFFQLVAITLSDFLTVGFSLARHRFPQSVFPLMKCGFGTKSPRSEKR